jgi:hypothetical protein
VFGGDARPPARATSFLRKFQPVRGADWAIGKIDVDVSDRVLRSGMLKGSSEGSVPMLMVTNVMQQIVAFYPPAIRAEIQAEIPTISIEAAQLGMQVLAAEHHGIRYAEAS